MTDTVEVASRKLSSFTGQELENILPSSPSVGICERYYKCSGERLTDLMTMCIGIQSEDDRNLGDCLVEPYASMKFRKKVVPTQKNMVEEIKRRSKCDDSTSPTPSCNYWTKERLYTWLTENPVDVDADVVFLMGEEKKLYDTVKSAGVENNNNGEPRSGAWTTNEPYLRLYHCMFHEDMKPALLRMNNTLSRPCLDARNSSARPETFFEGVARIFNNTCEDFMSDALPDLHNTFAVPMMLDFEDMPGPIDAEDVKRRFADARAKLIKIISKWELSGNGFGQRALDEDEFGHMAEENLEAGDNRGNFLDSKTKEHVLYFWHMADKNELLKNVLNVIAETSAADTDTFQSTSDVSSVATTAARRRTAEVRAASDFRSQMGQAMATMSMTALMQELREAEAQAMKYQELCITTDNPRLIALYTKFGSREEDRISDLQDALDRVKRRKVGGSKASLSTQGMTASTLDSSDEEYEF